MRKKHISEKYPTSHLQNNKRIIKANEQQEFYFCGGSERSRFKRVNCLKKMIHFNYWFVLFSSKAAIQVIASV